MQTGDEAARWVTPFKFELETENSPGGRRRKRLRVAGGDGSVAYPSIFSTLTGPDIRSEGLEDPVDDGETLDRILMRASDRCEKVLREYRYPHHLSLVVVLPNDEWRWAMPGDIDDPKIRGLRARLSRGATTLANRYPGTPAAFAHKTLVYIANIKACVEDDKSKTTAIWGLLAGEYSMRAFFASTHERSALVGRSFKTKSKKRQTAKKSRLPSLQTCALEIRAAMADKGISFTQATNVVARKYGYEGSSLRKRFKVGGFEDLPS